MTSTEAATPAKIGLVMMVKNEAEALEKYLPSVVPLICEYVIVDTGSSDRTREVIAEELESVPGLVLTDWWLNFGHNRTVALQAAFAERQEADWWLFLDADMTVEFHDQLLSWLGTDPDPDVVAWQVQLHEFGTNYRLPLLIRQGAAASYVGKTHEYLLVEGKQRPLLGLTVNHYADGAGREEKFQRDITLLAEDVAAEEPRATFYTAECYRFLGNNHEAIKLYRKRIEMGGWEEEVWYSEYQIAALKGSVKKLIKAWKKRPHRCEPLLAAARIVAQGGTDDILFVESCP